MRFTRLGAMSGLLALGVASPLFAQRRASVETGVAAARYPDDDWDVGGAWARVSLEERGPRRRGAIATTILLAPGAATGAATASGSWRAMLWPETVFEGSGELSALGSTTTGDAESAIAAARLMRGTLDGGIWVRGSADLARRRSGAVPGGGVALGAWRPMSDGVVSATVQRQWTRALLFAGSRASSFLGTAPERYTEATVDLQVDRGPAAVALSAGARHDPDAAEHVEAILNADLQLWLSPDRAFTVAFARLPADYVHRADAVRMVSVGMRFGERQLPARPGESTRPLVVVTDHEGVRAFAVRASTATRVEVMADFTDWAPVALRRVGELFVLDAPLSSGTHRLQIRIDDGPWIFAANTPAVDDDLGGRVGLLVVP